MTSLRSDRVLDKVWRLIEGMERRGVRVLLAQVMGTHIHLAVIPDSREALHNATRYFFGLLARFLNKVGGGRRGAVFTDRFASRVARSAADAWNVVNYLVRNPRDAGMPISAAAWDRGLRVRIDHLIGDGFLRRIFGRRVRAMTDLLWQMRHTRLRYASLWQDPQLTLWPA